MLIVVDCCCWLNVVVGWLLVLLRLLLLLSLIVVVVFVVVVDVVVVLVLVIVLVLVLLAVAADWRRCAPVDCRCWLPLLIGVVLLIID